jgi:hypothetical protein
VLKVLAVPDETMEFRASLRGIHVGVVQTAIGRPGWVDGRRAIIVRSRAKSEGLAALLGEISWELQSTIDLEGGFPIEDREEAWIDLAGQREHHADAHTWSGRDDRHDVHSAIGVLRGWQADHGERATVRMTLGGGHFQLAVWNAGRELVSDRPAVRYDGSVVGMRQAPPFSIWVSDDAARVPLAFQADTPLGAIGVELVDYQVASN